MIKFFIFYSKNTFLQNLPVQGVQNGKESSQSFHEMVIKYLALRYHIYFYDYDDSFMFTATTRHCTYSVSPRISRLIETRSRSGPITDPIPFISITWSLTKWTGFTVKHAYMLKNKHSHNLRPEKKKMFRNIYFKKFIITNSHILRHGPRI